MPRQRVRQPHEIGDRQLLGTRIRAHAGGLDRFAVAEFRQRVAQGLATLPERVAHHVGEAPGVGDADGLRCAWHQPHHCRVHLRRRPERSGRYVEQRVHRAVRLQHHAEPAVDLAAGLRAHAVDDLLLQHEDHVVDRRSVVERVEQDRRGQVVGQVADQPQRACVAGQRGEVDLQHVAVDHRQGAVRLRGLRQREDQIAVELDHGQFAVAVEQRKGDRALAGTDLDQAVARLRIHRQHDAVDDAAVVQEVLAQVLFCRLAEAVVAGAHARIVRRRRAIRAQVSAAANRLDGSARPRPASSSAVPWSTATRG